MNTRGLVGWVRHWSRYIWSKAPLVGISLAFVIAMASGTRAQTTDTGVAQRTAIAEKIYALVQQYFAHWDGEPRLDVENAYREYLREAERAGTRKGFDLAALRFIARLHTGRGAHGRKHRATAGLRRRRVGPMQAAFSC